MDILKELFIIASSLLCNFPLTGGDDNNLVEKLALGAWLKMFISNFFWLERTHFPVTLAPYIFKIFCKSWWDIQLWDQIQQIVWRNRQIPKGFIEIWEHISVMVILKD